MYTRLSVEGVKTLIIQLPGRLLNYFVPRVFTNFGKGFFYGRAVLWNSLLSNVSEAATMPSFKNLYFNSKLFLYLFFVIYFVLWLWRLYGSQKCQPYNQTCLNGIRDVSPSLGWISNPRLPCSAPMDPIVSVMNLQTQQTHSRKQTSQLSPVIALCMHMYSVQV